MKFSADGHCSQHGPTLEAHPGDGVGGRMARVADAIIGSRKPRDPGNFNLLFAWQRT